MRLLQAALHAFKELAPDAVDGLVEAGGGAPGPRGHFFHGDTVRVRSADEAPLAVREFLEAAVEGMALALEGIGVFLGFIGEEGEEVFVEDMAVPGMAAAHFEGLETGYNAGPAEEGGFGVVLTELAPEHEAGFLPDFVHLLPAGEEGAPERPEGGFGLGEQTDEMFVGIGRCARGWVHVWLGWKCRV